MALFLHSCTRPCGRRFFFTFLEPFTQRQQGRAVQQMSAYRVQQMSAYRDLLALTYVNERTIQNHEPTKKPDQTQRDPTESWRRIDCPEGRVELTLFPSYDSQRRPRPLLDLYLSRWLRTLFWTPTCPFSCLLVSSCRAMLKGECACESEGDAHRRSEADLSVNLPDRRAEELSTYVKSVVKTSV
jgi:hypothetical protein